MNLEIMNRVAQAVQNGAVPSPVQGESIDDFRFRTAHAGALVALQWVTEQAVVEEARRAADTGGRPSDVTDMSTPVTEESAGV